MRLSNRIALILSLVPVVLLGGVASAQDAEAPLFVERIDVNIVNVEVWVTDGDGRRVQGLEKGDFELLEDGVPVEISNFYSAKREKPYAEMLEGVPAPLPASTAEVPRTLPPDQTLHMILLVDNFNTLPGNRSRALDELEPFLEDRLRQGDKVMLMGYNQSTEVVEPFTDDWSRIQAGLKRMRKASSQKAIREAERKRRIRGMIQAWENGDSASTAFDMVRGQVQQEEQEIRQTGKALRELVRSLAGMPGRKAVVYVSEGMPKRPGETLYQQFFDLFGRTDYVIDPFAEAIRQDQAPLLNSITREANANQVTLYTVDASGTKGTALSADQADLSAGSGGTTSLAVARTLNNQETLIDIADATGGSAVINTFNLDRAMTRVAEDFDIFYSLGYAARQGGDGKFHKIEVRVKQPGLKVRHRPGFLDKPLVERVADRTLSSLVLDMERNPLDVRIDFGIPEKQSRGAYHLPVMIRIPVDRLTLLPNGEIEEGRLRIFLAVKDEKGLSDMQEFPYEVSIPAGESESGEGREVGYAVTLKIRPGTPTIAVGVWDELSGTDAFVHKQVRIDKRSG